LIEIGHRPVGRETRRIELRRTEIHLEAEERQPVRRKKLPDRRQGHAVLLHVKQQVAAFAGGEEVIEERHVAQRRAVRMGHHFRADRADIVEARSVSAFRDEGARRHDVTPRGLAVERDEHHAAGAQQRLEHAPAGPRIGEMMQHAR
jgi:hypothetical protein